jgi:hypothetical protein
MPRLSFVVVCLLLAGCAQETPYRAPTAESDYGYSERWLDQRLVEVSFAGNWWTRPATVQNHTLYRVAELTLAQGGDRFILLDRQLTPTTYVWYSPSGYHPFGYRHYGHFGRPMTQRRNTRYTGRALVRILEPGEPAPGSAEVQSAAAVKARLAPEVLWPESP